jgi:hypothetical protein
MIITALLVIFTTVELFMKQLINYPVAFRERYIFTKKIDYERFSEKLFLVETFLKLTTETA